MNDTTINDKLGKVVDGTAPTATGAMSTAAEAASTTDAESATAAGAASTSQTSADPTQKDSNGRRPAWVSAALSTVLSPVPIALIVGAALTAVVGSFGVPIAQGWQAPLTVGLAAMFLIGASGRLGPQRKGLIAMVPPALPRPDLIVAATGILEAAGAIGLLVPTTHRIAAICLALLLVCVFPANVHAARAGVDLAGKPVTPLVPRTIEQLVYIAVCVAVAVG